MTQIHLLGQKNTMVIFVEQRVPFFLDVEIFESEIREKYIRLKKKGFYYEGTSTCRFTNFVVALSVLWILFILSLLFYFYMHLSYGLYIILFFGSLLAIFYVSGMYRKKIQHSDMYNL